jgi:hypothetical protein
VRRTINFEIAAAALLLFYAPPAWAQGIGALGQENGPTEVPHWIRELVAAVLVLIMVAVMVWLMRPSKAGAGSADFRILVDGPEVEFRGRFPAHLEGILEDFLLEDCQINGPYEVRGKWEEGRLVVHVFGESAAPLEQRIRNFLKLNVKRPS